MTELKDIHPSKIQQKRKDNIVLIDVRRPSEWEMTGVIEDSHLLTFFDEFGNYDINSWMRAFQKLVTTKDQEFILICAHANRTRTIGEYLIQNQGYLNVGHLEGGIAIYQRMRLNLIEFKNQ